MTGAGYGTLHGRLVVVTGASRGISREIAVRTAKAEALPLMRDMRYSFLRFLNDRAVPCGKGVSEFAEYRRGALEEDLAPNLYLTTAPEAATR